MPIFGQSESFSKIFGGGKPPLSKLLGAGGHCPSSLVMLVSVQMWNGSLTLLCPSAVDCGSLDDPANGMVTLSQGTTTLNSIAVYSCDVGFTLVVPSHFQRICQFNGMWSPEPACRGEGTLR